MRSCCLCLLCLAVLPVAGCSFFTSFPPEKQDGVPAETGSVSQHRQAWRKTNRKFICLIALSGKPYAWEESGKICGIEPDIIRALAEKLQLQVDFVIVPVQRISAYLRNGRGDIAAGAMRADTIQTSAMSPVLLYNAGGDDRRAFCVRADDSFWNNELTAAAESLNVMEIVAAYAALVSGTARVSVQNAGDEQDESMPVSVDMGTENK